MRWHEYGIDEVCELIVDCVNRTAPVVDHETPYKMIRTSNVRDGWIDMSDARNVTKDTYESWTRRAVPRQGDVVLTREAPLGEVGLIRTDDPVFLGQRTVMYRTNLEKMLPHFLFYSLLSQDVQAQIQAFGFGSTVSHMRVPDAKKLRLKAPDTATQEKIIYIMDAYDSIIEANQRRIQLLEESARLLYREWFVMLRFPGHETVPVKDGVPKGWEKKTLGDICDDIRDGVDPKEISAGTPYLSMEHMPQRSLSLIDWDYADKVGSTKLKFVNSDILFGKIRPYFHKVGIAPINGITSTDVLVIRARKPEYLPLITLTVSSDDFIAYAVTTSNGTKMPRANWKVLRKRHLLIPSQQLLTSLADIFLPILDQIRSIGLHNRALRQARDLILPKLMSGSIDVSRISPPP